MANACCLARCQAPVNARLRPGMWAPGIRNPHLSTETWELNVSPECNVTGFPWPCADGKCQPETCPRYTLVLQWNKYRLVSLNRLYDAKQCLLHSSWLAHMETNTTVNFTYKRHCLQGTIAQARSFSSGLCPACCPLSSLFNCLCFLAPFPTYGVNDHRLEAIRKAIKGAEVQLTHDGPD